MPMTLCALVRASRVTALMTPLMPGAGPPPTTIPRLLFSAGMIVVITICSILSVRFSCLWTFSRSYGGNQELMDDHSHNCERARRSFLWPRKFFERGPQGLGICSDFLWHIDCAAVKSAGMT